MPIRYSVDFHCHTIAFRDSLTTPEMVIRAAHRRGLDRLILTDHNTIARALAAFARNPELVVIGEEIITTSGEILAYYESLEIPPRQLPQETINRLLDLGGFISIAHPFDTWRSGSWIPGHLLEITSEVDAIEVFNAHCLVPRGNPSCFTVCPTIKYC